MSSTPPKTTPRRFFPSQPFSGHLARREKLAEVEATGGTRSIPELVNQRVELARSAGLAGVVASAREAGHVRSLAPRPFLIVTPGIRPEGAARGDQARAVTPLDAVQAGSDVLVVGRPITQAADPVSAAWAIRREMEGD